MTGWLCFSLQSGNNSVYLNRYAGCYVLIRFFLIPDPNGRSAFPYMPVSMVVPQPTEEGGPRLGPAHSRIMFDVASLYPPQLLYSTSQQAVAQPTSRVTQPPTAVIPTQPAVVVPSMTPSELPKVCA